MVQIYKNILDTLSITDNQPFDIVDIFDNVQGKKKISLGSGTQGNYLLIAKQSDFEVIIETQGEDIQAKIFVILVSHDHQTITGKVQTNLSHSHTRIDQYMLSLLKDDADISVDGIINIGEGIVQTEGYLLEENLILGEKAKIKTLPMLDVRSNDIKASHGAKIDRVDKEKLFYMSSKGISQKQAQELIVSGYINNILDQFTGLSEEERKEIHDFLDT